MYSYKKDIQSDDALYGAVAVLDEASIAKKRYFDYKNGVKSTYTEDELLDIEVLDLLEKMNFDFDDLGTFLYKNVIKNIVNSLMVFSKGAEIEELKRQIQIPTSQFYFNISRNELDMGVKTFHGYIKNAVLSIKGSDNQEFGSIDYKNLALVFAYYILNSSEEHQRCLSAEVKSLCRTVSTNQMLKNNV